MTRPRFLATPAEPCRCDVPWVVRWPSIVVNGVHYQNAPDRVCATCAGAVPKKVSA